MLIREEMINSEYDKDINYIACWKVVSVMEIKKKVEHGMGFRV